MVGGREGIRTPDPLLAKQVLSQLSYTPTGDSASVSYFPENLRHGQAGSLLGRAYSHRIPLAGLKCLSEKRRLELAARLGGEPGGKRRVDLPRHGYFRRLF